MKFANVIHNAAEFIKSIKLTRDPKLSKLDFGILQVALMVAALDGKVQTSEIDTFTELAKRCRGYSKKAAEEALNRSMRSAGYLMLLAQVANRKVLLARFLEEALAIMPSGFVNGSIEDVRRAFITWTAMAIGDGEFSEVEREAILQLKKTWCDIKTAMSDAQIELWLAMSPTIKISDGNSGQSPAKIKLIADDFLDRVEKAIIKFNDAKLAEIIKNG